MPATARQIPVTDEDLAGTSGGGAYAELEVPGDFEAILRDVNDYDKRAEGKSYGWIFEYEVEAPSGAMLPFKIWLSFSQAARWKLVEVLEAHEVDLTAGLNDVDPNSLIDDVIGVTIDFPRDKEDNPTSDFREIRATFALAEEPGTGGNPVVETAEVPDII